MSDEQGGRGDVGQSRGNLAADGRETEVNDDRFGEPVRRHGRGALGNGLNARGRNDRARRLVREGVRAAVLSLGTPHGRCHCPATKVFRRCRLLLSQSQAGFVGRVVLAGVRSPAANANARGHQHQQGKNNG